MKRTQTKEIAPAATDITGSELPKKSDWRARVDPRAKAAYRKRLAEFRAELDRGKALNDLGGMAKARNQIEALGFELARALGLDLDGSS